MGLPQGARRPSKSFTPVSRAWGGGGVGRQSPGAFPREARGSGKVSGGMTEKAEKKDGKINEMSF